MRRERDRKRRRISWEIPEVQANEGRKTNDGFAHRGESGR